MHKEDITELDLTETEKELIDAFRSLPEEEKEAFLEYLSETFGETEEDKPYFQKDR